MAVNLSGPFKINSDINWDSSDASQYGGFQYKFTGNHSASLLVTSSGVIRFQKTGESGLVHNRTYDLDLNGDTIYSNRNQPTENNYYMDIYATTGRASSVGTSYPSIKSLNSDDVEFSLLTPYGGTLSNVSSPSNFNVKDYNLHLYLKGNEFFGTSGTIEYRVRGKIYDDILKHTGGFTVNGDNAVLSNCQSKGDQGLKKVLVYTKGSSDYRYIFADGSNKITIPIPSTGGIVVRPIMDPIEESRNDTNPYLKLLYNFYNDDWTLYRNTVSINTLTANGNVLSWTVSNSNSSASNANPYDGEYEIYKGNTLIGTTTSKSYTIPNEYYRGDVASYRVEVVGTTNVKSQNSVQTSVGKTSSASSNRNMATVRHNYLYVHKVGNSKTVITGSLLSPTITYSRSGVTDVIYSISSNNAITTSYGIEVYQGNSLVYSTTTNQSRFNLSTAIKAADARPNVSYRVFIKAIYSSYTSTASSVSLQLQQIPTPSNYSLVRRGVNKLQVSWDASQYAGKYIYNIYTAEGNPVLSKTITGTSDEFELNSLGTYKATIVAVYEANTYFNSNAVTTSSISLTKLSTPIITSTQNTIRSGLTTATLDWNPVSEAVSYSYKVDEGEYINTTDTIATISDLSVGTHTFYVRANYSIEEFNSKDASITGSFTRLSTPVLSKTDSQISSTTTPYITLNWNPITYAGISTGESKGSFYRLKHSFTYYDVVNGYGETVTTIPYTGLSSLSQLVYGDITSNNDVGRHEWSIQAYYTEDDAYNSDWSNVVSYDIAVIETPEDAVLSYDYTTFTGKTRAYLTWTEFPNANRYRIYTPEAVQSKKNRDTADLEYNYYDGVNIQEPGIYTIKLTGFNTNHYYWRESSQELAPSLVYTVKKLATPENLKWNSNTNTLSWDSVLDAVYYEIYTYDAKSNTESFRQRVSGTSWTNNFGAGTFTVRVYACYEDILNDVDINNQLTPKYLKSDYAEVNFGFVLAPNGLGIRYNSNGTATLYWNAVVNADGVITADGYIIKRYVNDVYDGIVRDIGDIQYVVSHDICPVSSDTYKFTVQAYEDQLLPNNQRVRTFSQENTITSWSFIVRKLAQSIITWNKADITYTAVPNANNYTILVNGSPAISYTEAKTLFVGDIPGIDTTITGTYSIGITTSNTDNPFLYVSNTVSSSTQYVVQQLSQPVLSFNSDTGILSWTNPNTYSITYLYKVHIKGGYTSNGEYIEVNRVVNTNDLSYDTSELDAGNYDIWVEITDSKYALHNNPLYLNSLQPDTGISFGVLPKLNITLTDNIVSWEYLDGADYYEVYDGETLILTTTENRYEMTSLEPKSFNIKVWAKSYSDSINDSESYSDYVLYVIYKLATPTITKTSESIISWTKSPIDGVKYEIYISGNLYNTIDATYIDITELGVYGEISFYIRAISSRKDYLDSDYSNTLQFTKRTTSKYVAIIDNISYDINIETLSMLFTKDETLDSAAVTLRAMDKSERFEKLTPIHIAIYPEEEGDIEIAGYDFLIADDDVKEVFYSNKTMYEHRLAMTELTRLLQTEFLPNFTITQPKEVAIRGLTEDILGEWDNEKMSQDVPSSRYLKDNAANLDKIEKVWPKYEYKEEIITPPKSGQYGYFDSYTYAGHGPFGVDVYENIKKKYSKGGSIVLPNITDEYFEYECAKTRFIDCSKVSFYKALAAPISSDETANNVATILGSTVAYLTIVGIIPEVVWAFTSDFVKRHRAIQTSTTSLYRIYPTRKYYLRNRATNVETLISENNTNSVELYTIPNSIQTGYYDLIMRIPGVTVNLPGGVKKTIEFMTTEDSLDMKPYEITWPNIEIVNEEVKHTQTGVKTLYYAINKAIDLVKPRRLKSKSLEDPKYILADEGNTISTQLYNILQAECPKIDFTNLTSLYDVLLELGRSFYGIPRLKYNNNRDLVITYDIQDKTVKGNPNFSEPDILYTRDSSDIANSATSFKSNLSNTVSDRRYIQYPSGDMWITPRSDTEDNPTVKLSTMAIALPKPIYALKSLKVRNCYNNYTAPVDITKYVYDDANYNALNSDANGKGKAIFYEQNGTKIRGLGQLPDTGEIRATLGLGESDYVIEKILDDIFPGLKYQRKKPLQYEYKVEYYTLNDALVSTELSNISGIKNPNAKPLNQEATLLSDRNFGVSALTQLKRLGNETISAVYRVSGIRFIPYVGQRKEYKGAMYYADRVAIAFKMNYIEASVSYSKNTATINPRVGVNSEYRLFRIYANNYVNRCININNYCYISTDKYAVDSDNTLQYMPAIIMKAYTSPVLPPDNLYIRPMDDNRNRLTTLDYYGNSVSRDAILLPLDCREMGTSLVLSASMYDNYSAGEAISNATRQHWITTLEVAAQENVPYTDINGECPYMSITIASPKESELKMSSPLSQTLPAVKYYNYIGGSTLSNTCYNEVFKLDKDNREAISFSYQLHFLTYDKNIIIHPGLVENIFKRLGSDEELKPEFYFYNKDYQDIANLDYSDTLEYAGDVVSENGYIKSITATPKRNYKGIAAVYKNQGYRIAFCYNTPDENPIVAGVPYTTPKFYFNFVHDKISYRSK